MDEIIAQLKAVSDPTRLRILMSLTEGELCACRIIALFNLAPSTISKHLSVLKHAGLVENRKEGKWIYFKLRAPASPITELLKNDLRDDRVIRADIKQLKKILKINQVRLCKTINNEVQHGNDYRKKRS